jgi:hypothetical protein
MVTITGGSFTKILMIVLGSCFMAASFAKSAMVRGGFNRAKRTPATRFQRAIFFVVGFAVTAEGVRLLFS